MDLQRYEPETLLPSPQHTILNAILATRLLPMGGWWPLIHPPVNLLSTFEIPLHLSQTYSCAASVSQLVKTLVSLMTPDRSQVTRDHHPIRDSLPFPSLRVVLARSLLQFTINSISYLRSRPMSTFLLRSCFRLKVSESERREREKKMLLTNLAKIAQIVWIPQVSSVATHMHAREHTHTLPHNDLFIIWKRM